MGKKLTGKQWIEACKKVIGAGDQAGLQKVLGYLEEAEAYLVYQAKEELIQYVAEHRAFEAIRTILKDGQFYGMGTNLILEAIRRNDPELLAAALEYANPNALIHEVVHETEGEWKRSHLGMYVDGINYYVTAEPLGVCAILGKREMAEVLLAHGARPDGVIPEDVMSKMKSYQRPFTCSKLEILMRRESDGVFYHERCWGMRRLPAWSYGMFCKDPRDAEFFLGLGEDRYTLELAMAVSMVHNGEIIRILQEKKPKLMAAIEPKYILRRFWPEAVKQYFSSGKEIPEDAVQMMGQYLFEEHNLIDEVNGEARPDFREQDFVETLTFLLKNGYRLTKEDLNLLTLWMVMFRSERLLSILKGKIPLGLDISSWLNILPVDGKNWGFGKKLADSGVKFRCVLGPELKCYHNYQYMELVRIFKLVEFERPDPKRLDQLTISALFSRSKKAMALLWKEGLINESNLSQAVKLICELQLTELYEFSAELAGTTGGSEVRYDL